LSDINSFYKHLKEEAVCFGKLGYCFEHFMTIERVLVNAAAITQV